MRGRGSRNSSPINRRRVLVTAGAPPNIRAAVDVPVSADASSPLEGFACIRAVGAALSTRTQRTGGTGAAPRRSATRLHAALGRRTHRDRKRMGAAGGLARRPFAGDRSRATLIFPRHGRRDRAIGFTHSRWPLPRFAAEGHVRSTATPSVRLRLHAVERLLRRRRGRLLERRDEHADVRLRPRQRAGVGGSPRARGGVPADLDRRRRLRLECRPSRPAARADDAHRVPRATRSR